MFTFDKAPRTLIRNLDNYMPPTIKNTFMLLRSFANIHTHQASIFIRVLAAYSDRNQRTINMHLAWLIEHGYIHRQLRKKKGNPKENDASLFTILRWDLPENNILDKEDIRQKISVPDEKSFSEKIDRESILRETNIKYTLKREAKTAQIIIESQNEKRNQEIKTAQTEVSKNPEPHSSPKQETLESLEAQPMKDQKPLIKAEREYDLSGIPDIMRYTAQYWLMKTGRTSLSDTEKALLSEMANTQYPTRIQKEIDTAVERFLATNRRPVQMNFNYIATCLEHQSSYSGSNKASKRNKKGRKKAAKAEQEQFIQQVNTEIVEADTLLEPEVPEATMTAETAEQIINNYEPALVQEPPMPRALQEWHEKLTKAQEEVVERYAMSLPLGEDGFPIWPDYETDEEELAAYSITLEEYLQVKFPNATAEELSLERENESTLSEMNKACKIDCACSICGSPESCLLPDGVNKKKAYPMISLEPDLRGHKRPVLRYGICIKCKHDYGKGKPDPDFAKKVTASGIAEKDMNNTFATYDHQAAGAEATIMKAFAVRAAQEKSNLILAGKAGTGKTHLAVAIALDAMRAGRKALVKSMAALLDEICLAHQEHTDPFGLMMKYKSVSCLVLDDWGKEKTSEARLDYLYQIINYRYEHKLQTIITTNAYDMEGLKNKWNADKIEPLVSRILENGDWVTIRECKNYRFQKRATCVTAEPEAEEPTITTVQTTSEESSASHAKEGKIIEQYETDEFKQTLGDACESQDLSETSTAGDIAGDIDSISESKPAIDKEESEYEIGSDWLPEPDDEYGDEELEEYVSQNWDDKWTEAYSSTDDEDGFVRVGSLFEERAPEPSKPIEQRDEEGFLLDEDGLPTIQGIGAERLSDYDYFKLAEYILAKRDRIEAERKKAAAESQCSSPTSEEVSETKAAEEEALVSDKKLPYSSTSEQGYTILHLPTYDDGLDDDEEDMRLYGATGIPGVDYDPNEGEDEDDYDRQLE